MYHYNFAIVFQEVPGEISLCFNISGCPLRCSGCHSPYLWKEKSGEKLTEDLYNEKLNQYRSMATCVLFMGGEWHQNQLIKYLEKAKKLGYKTCLYTGREQVDEAVLKHLTWIKTGKWNPKLGGLDNLKTNQKFIEVKTQKQLNYLFLKK